MQIPPVAVIASWPTPNYIDPVTRGPANTIMNLIFFPILMLIVGIRTYARIRLSKNFGLDDALILVAMVSRSLSDVRTYLTSLVAYYRLHAC